MIPPPTVSIIDPDLVTPRNWNSQVGYRRELMADLGLDVSFVYNRGYDHVGIINTNLGADGTASSTGANPVRPDPNFTTKSFYTNYGEIEYRGLLVELKKRFSNNFQGGVTYALSKTENNSFNFVSGLQVPSQPDLERGSRRSGPAASHRGARDVRAAVRRAAWRDRRLPHGSAAQRRRERTRSERRRQPRATG